MSDALGILVLGCIYGATTCSVACLPMMAPYLLLAPNGFKEGAVASLSYLAGKALMYACWGALAGITGRSLFFGDGTGLRLIQAWMLILAGLALPFLSRGSCAGRCPHPGTKTSLFALGASTSLAPCLPLSNLLLAAAKSGSILNGIVFGLIFGVAIAITPLFIGGMIGQIGRILHTEAKPFLPSLRILSACVLVILGIRSLR